MKSLISIAVLLMLLSSCSSSKKVIFIPNSANYVVTKVDKKNSWYIIYAERKDTLYKIVSYAENEIDEKCNKLIEGKRYNFNLKSRKENAPTISGTKLDPVGYTGCFEFDSKTNICLEPELGIYDLFFTSNIKGICYIPIVE